MRSRLSPPENEQTENAMKSTAVVFATIGCLTLLTFLFVYTSSINIFLVWDAKTYRYLAICAGLMIAAIFGAALLAAGKTGTSGPAIAVLLLTALITQLLFGFDLYTVMAVGLLYAAALIECTALNSDTVEESQQQ